MRSKPSSPWMWRFSEAQRKWLVHIAREHFIIWIRQILLTLSLFQYGCWGGGTEAITSRFTGAEWISSVISERSPGPLDLISEKWEHVWWTANVESGFGDQSNLLQVWFCSWNMATVAWTTVTHICCPNAPIVNGWHSQQHAGVWVSVCDLATVSDAQLGIRCRRNWLSSAFTTFYYGTKQRNIIPYWNPMSVSQFLLTLSQKSLFFVFFWRISSCYSFALFTGEQWADKNAMNFNVVW